MRMTLKSSRFKYGQKNVLIWFSFNLNGFFFFNFSNPHLTKYLNLKSQNQLLIRDDETSTITLDETKIIWAEANKSSVS